MADRRDAIAEDLRALATDLKTLLDDATTDPKERQRKERRWTAIYAVSGIVASLAARQVATKVWRVLTGEQPPLKGPPPARRAPAEERQPVSRV
jgi:hypothetical protein